MLRKIVCLFAVLPFVALLAAPAHAGKHDPLYTPDPIQVPAGKSGEDVKKAVKKAFFSKGWQTREIGPGHVQGKYAKTGKNDSYSAVVDVKFDNKGVRIGYKDSENLNYQKSDNTIHGTYNRWVKSLEREIRGNLGAY